jgi:serine/threonine protein kinase
METNGWAVPVSVGYRVDGWEVHTPIATGSWGSVYEGRRASKPEPEDGLPDRAALKFLPTGTLTQRQLSHLMEMTRREVQAYERLVHPRLIRLFETFTVDDPESPHLDGAVVLVMELAADSLGNVLSRHAGQPINDAPRIIAEICEGLAHMHASGWVHGDLKPNNVLIMADGSVRLADFGLATELEGTHGYLPPAGSSDYMPPERWNEPLSEHGMAIRTTADIWALGVTTYQLLTGRLPFPGTTARARAAAAAEYAAGRRELMLSLTLSPGWRALVQDCLAADHQRRACHDATALLTRIRALAREPVTLEQSARAAVRRVRLRAAAATACGVALLAAGGAAITPLTGSHVGNSVRPAATTNDAYSRWLRPDADIPAQYRQLIIEAGTTCNEPGVSPALVAAILKTESNFDPNLSDPANDEYGIARWTPRVLRYHLPPGQRAEIPKPPFPPEVSIPAVGRYLCWLAPQLKGIPGERSALLAAAYRTSAGTVRNEGLPVRWRHYTDQVRTHLDAYQPTNTTPTR